jgi:epoxyqueuosine reductase QueG
MILEQHPTVIEYRRASGTSGKSPAASRVDAQRLKKLVLDAGADDVGLVEVDRPGIAAYRPEIDTVFPDARTVVSVVCRLNPDNIRSVSRSTSDTEFLQGANSVNAVCWRASRSLMAQGIRSASPSTGFPQDMEGWPGKVWPLSHKPLAVEAGLGKIGHSRMVLHPRYGTFVALGTILIDAEATGYDRPLDFNPCLECKLCTAVCPVGAIAKDGL